jgi:hypothetical protein
MTFEDLHSLANQARSTRTFVLDVGQFAADAVQAFRLFLETPAVTIQGVVVALASPNEIILRGTCQLGFRLDCELRFFREQAGIGYSLTFATRRPASMLKGELRKVADLVNIDTLWWTASSRAIDAFDIAISGLEAKAMRIREGFENFHIRIDNPILRTLGLADAVFDVLLSGSIPSFSIALKRDFALPPVLKARFNKVTISPDGRITFDSEVMLKLLGQDLGPIPALLGFEPDRVAIRLPVPGTLAMPAGLPFKTIALKNTFVEVAGQLNGGNYGVAADGDFTLPGTGHGGDFRFKYSAGNATPIPDMIHLTAETLTLSDAMTLVSPVPIRLPTAIDKMIAIRNAYLYYSAGPDVSRDGVPIEPGTTARGSVTVLGQAGYFSADYRPDGLRAAVLTNAIRIGDILVLRGFGVTAPRQYRGPAFASDAMAISLDTVAGTASADLQVQFLGKPLQRLMASIEQTGLRVETRTSLPNLPELKMAVLADNRLASLEGDFNFASQIDLELPAGLQGFRLRGAARVSGQLAVEQPVGGQPISSVTATLELMSFRVSATFGIDPSKINDLANQALQHLLEEAKKVLNNALEFVKAFLSGAVKYVLSGVDAAEKLVAALVNKFNTTAEGVVALMNEAGATATQALDFVREGAAAFGQLVYSKVIEALRVLYNAEEALAAMRHWAEQFGGDVARYAENLACLLKQGGYAAEVIAKEAWAYVQHLEKKFEAYVSALAWGGLDSKQVAKALKSLSVSVEDAGKLIGKMFGTDILKAALTPAYGLAEATRVGENVSREMGRFGRNVEREIGDFACGRLGICL